MIIVGLTGGLATGKSLVAELLRLHGAVIFSADEAARAVVAPDGPALRKIVAAFGSDILDPTGNLDRGRLGKRIFADAQARHELDQITHPPILRLLRAQIDAVRADLPPHTIAVFEIPLLFETKLQDWFERIVVVSASESVQVARLCARNRLDPAEAARRLAAQWPLAEKVARADYVLQNDGSRASLAESVDVLWNWLRQSDLSPRNMDASRT